MGKFEVDCFVTTPDPDLICCVCCCVLDDPLESPCQHVYCKVCICTWLTNRKSCPNCRSRLRKSRLKPVLPIVRNMINRLQIRCGNVENGCTQVVQLENYNNHAGICEYTFVSCKNDDCNEKVLRKDLDEHEHRCLHRLTKCEKGCDLLLPLGKLTGHNCLSELKEKLQKVEDNLQTVTLKMTDVEKRMLVLERRHQRIRSDRSPFFSRRLSPPLPWNSPSIPNQNRSRSEDRNTGRYRQTTQIRDQTQSRDIPQSRSRRRDRYRSGSGSPHVNRRNNDLNNGIPRRSRSRSWSLFQSSPSRSRSRSPVRGDASDSSDVSSFSNIQSESSTSLSSFLHNITSDEISALLNSSDDSFYSEMNRSFSSESLTTNGVSGSPAGIIESTSSTDYEFVGATEGRGEEEDYASPPSPAAVSQQPDNTAMNTSVGEVDLLSIESENQEERDVISIRRSSRLAASRDAAKKFEDQERTNGDSSSNQRSTSFSAVPILSRSTIESIMSAGEESSNESSWRPESEGTTSDCSILDDEDDTEDSCNSSTHFRSSEQRSHWATLLEDYNSSDTDDTWSLGSHINRRSSHGNNNSSSNRRGQSRNHQDAVVDEESLH